MMLTPQEISSALRCPLANVQLHWPNLVAALEEQGINTMAMQIATAATVAVETTIFMPLRERRANRTKQPALWALQERYWASGFYGRGFIQLTWRGNYLDAGEALGLDLVALPDLALEPGPAARILAYFLKARSVQAAAEAQDWKKVRRLVNGGKEGLDLFLAHVAALQRALA